MAASWATTCPIIRLISSGELLGSNQAQSEVNASPVVKLKNDARKHFDGIAVSITNEKWKERWKSMCAIQSGSVLDGLEEDEEERKKRDREIELRAEQWRAAPSFLREECTMISLEEAENVIGVASEWLELDSPDDWVRHDCEIVLKQELAYAAYLGVTTVVLPPPIERLQAASYGRAIQAVLNSSLYLQLVIRLPLFDPNVLSSNRRTSVPTPVPSPGFFLDSPGSSALSSAGSVSERRSKVLGLSSAELSTTWEVWDTIRSICGYHPRLSIALDLTLPLPSAEKILSRWTAEPVSHIFLPASTFISNAKGYPVLPKPVQTFLQTMMRTQPTFIMAGTGEHLHARGTEDKYVDYLRYLEKSSPHLRRMQEANTLENYAQGYQDFLQMPLQPLQDHLASMVYENFERDPVKYQKYEEAVYRALLDRLPEERIILTVAGAGRGPLVARSLKAIERSRKNVTVYAIEKNPSAYVTLQHRQQTEWKEKVTVLFGDMRHLDVPEQADILVSELLGSFGDNELSPECLDGAMRFLKDDGISIPSSYAAFLAPIQSAKLHHEAGGSKDAKEKDREKGLETPYVVMLQSFNFLGEDASGGDSRSQQNQNSGRIKQCWEFEHPRKDAALCSRGLPITNTHNARTASLTFKIPYAGILHGFAGYFEAVLYDTVGLSIHPERKDVISKDMLSWFPCFFPIKEPLYLPGNSELRVFLWRLTGLNRVWYEWYAEAFLPVAVATTPSTAPPSSSPRLIIPETGDLATNGAPPSPSPRSANEGGLLAAQSAMSPSPSLGARSPVLDAIDVSFGSESTAAPFLRPDEGEPSMVKIGQTTLHNPGGRSSWIGL